MKKLYTQPTVSAIGTLSSMTLANKLFGTGDAFTFQNQPTCVEGLTCVDTSP